MRRQERGVVRAVNVRRERIAIELDAGGYIIAELLAGPEPDVGDQVTGHLPSLGGETLWDVTQGTDLRVFVEDLDVSARRARAWVGGA